jgi:hypothetical protein
MFIMSLRPTLSDLRIETNDDLMGIHGLSLIHPWISPLLDRDFIGGTPQFDLVTHAFKLWVVVD